MAYWHPTRSCAVKSFPLRHSVPPPGVCTGSSEVASRRMRISTLDISRITTTVRRHEALLRFARYLFVYNLVIFLLGRDHKTSPRCLRSKDYSNGSRARHGNSRRWCLEASAQVI